MFLVLEGLPALAVDVEPHVERLRIGDFVCRLPAKGPIGPKVSAPLPLSHCEDWSWKARSETSLTMV